VDHLDAPLLAGKSDINDDLLIKILAGCGVSLPNAPCHVIGFCSAALRYGWNIIAQYR